MSKGKLTLKQEKFCLKYLECGNASEAYRYAFDCSNTKDSTVWVRACELLQNGKVSVRLSQLKENLAEAAGVSALRVLREHMKIAFSDATHIRKDWMTLKEFELLTDDERAFIKSVETRQVRKVTSAGDDIVEEQVRVTCYDKQKALDSIVDMLGYSFEDRLNADRNTDEDDSRIEFIFKESIIEKSNGKKETEK